MKQLWVAGVLRGKGGQFSSSRAIIHLERFGRRLCIGGPSRLPINPAFEEVDGGLAGRGGTVGEGFVTIEGKSQVARPNIIAIVPANTRHSVKALTSGSVIVVDHPARPEFG